MGDIHTLLPKLADYVGAVGKGGYNESQKYAFRGIDQLQNAVHPALVKFGITVYPVVTEKVVTERETVNVSGRAGVMRFVELTVDYHWVAGDGSEIVTTVVGEAADSGDKASNKAMSAAYKYALIQTLCIPLTSEEDADSFSPVLARPIPSRGTARERAAGQAKPATDSQLKWLPTLGGEAGIDDLDGWLEKAVGAPLAKLTTAQASKAIDELQEIKKVADS